MKQMLPLLFLLSITLIQIHTKDQLLKVQLTHRHGARYPIYDVPGTEPFKPHFGELSNVGNRELFQLGQYLRQHYIKDQDENFLTSDYNSKFLQIYNTGRNRTIDSVNSLLSGLYGEGTGSYITQDQEEIALPPWNSQNKNQQYQQQQELHQLSEKEDEYALPGRYQPIAMHPIDDTILLAFDANVCPLMKNETEFNIYESEPVKQILKDQDESVKKFCKITGEKYPTDLLTISKYVDTWIAFLHTNPDYTDKMLEEALKDDKLWKDLYYLNSIYFFIIQFQNLDKIQLTSTPYFDNIFSNFDSTFDEKDNRKDQKLVIYSAHDSTVAMVWARLNLTSWECQREQYAGRQIEQKICLDSFPIYSSQITFELWQKDTDKSYYIKVLSDGEYMPLEVCDWAYECEYNEYKEKIMSTQVENFDLICGTKKVVEVDNITKEEHTPTWFIIILAIIGANVGVLGVMIFSLYRKAHQVSRTRTFQQAPQN